MGFIWICPKNIYFPTLERYQLLTKKIAKVNSSICFSDFFLPVKHW